MTNNQSNLISMVAREVKTLVGNDGVFIQLDILNESYGDTITQEDIDAIPSLKDVGLTVAQFQACVYILKQVHVQINTDLTAMVTMANLS